MTAWHESEDELYNFAEETAKERCMMAAWHEAEDELYVFAEATAKEWYALKIVDDRQYLALMKLLHEMEKRTYYEWRRDDADN